MRIAFAVNSALIRSSNSSPQGSSNSASHCAQRSSSSSPARSSLSRNCCFDQPIPAHSTEIGAAEKLDKVRFTYAPLSASGFLWFVAKDAGYFEKNRLDVDMYFEGASPHSCVPRFVQRIAGNTGGCLRARIAVGDHEMAPSRAPSRAFAHRCECTKCDRRFPCRAPGLADRSR